MKKIRRIKKMTIPSKEITLFFRKLATLTTAGIPLVQALEILISGVTGSSFAKIIYRIKHDIEQGIPLSNALKKYPKQFDVLYCHLIWVGEQTGCLETLLNRIAFHKEKNEALKQKIKKALYYPLFVLVLTLTVTATLLMTLVPIFQDLFKSFNVELPLLTQWILAVSLLIQHYGIYLLASMIILVTGLKQLYSNNLKFKTMLQMTLFKLPLLSNIIQKIFLSRFSYALSIITKSGIPFLEALEMVSHSSNNIVYVNAIKTLQTTVARGQPIHRAMQKISLFSPMMIQLTNIGEESGTLEEMFSKAANFYEEELNTILEGLTTFLEPLMMIILGIIIGGLVIALYLPIFKMGALT